MPISSQRSSPFNFSPHSPNIYQKRLTKMRSSGKLISLTLSSLIISSFATIPDQVTFSLSPSSSSPPTPLPTLESKAVTFNVGSSLKEWCNSTDYPDLCESAIAPFIKGKLDLYNAICIAIKSAVSATKTTILAGTKFANSPFTPSDLATVLKDALSSLDDALDNFQQAQDALPQRDWGTVNTMLSGAITDFGDVEDQLSNYDMPLLMEFSEKLTKMTSNCLALSALFDPQPGY